MSRAVPYDIISIGDATLDVFLVMSDATLECTLNRRDCVICFRYADKIPVDAVHRVPAAGNAANNAIGSARLGLATAFYSILGADDEGRAIRAELKKNNVAMPYVMTDRRRRTNYSVVINFQSERTIFVYHEHRTYRLPKLASAFFVYLTSMGPGWERIAPSLRRYLKAAGALLAFNPGTHQLKSGLRVLRPLLAQTAVLLVNREEAALLLRAKSSADPRTLLRELSDLGPNVVVITDGTQGSYAFRNGAAWSMPAFPIPSKERTGAGDAYSTGFLAALAYGTEIPEAMRWGTMNAGSVCQYIGPQAGLLTLSTMRRMLRRYPKLAAKQL